MKKINIEIYPTGKNRDFTPKYLEFSLTKIVLMLLLVGVSIAGFLLFDIETLKTNVFNGQLDAIKSNNSKLHSTILKTKEHLNDIKKNLYAIDKINQKVNALAGSDSLVTLITTDEYDTLSLPKLHYKIFNLKNYFEEVHEEFSENSLWRHAIPVIHPLITGFHISNYFANNLDPFTGKHIPHLGIDYVGGLKDTVIATGAGYVVSVDEDDLFGKSILIHHTQNIYSFYAHLGRTYVRDGKSVKRGQPIGLLGNSGRSSGPHLHYEIRLNKDRVNPLDYILSDLP